MRRSLSGGAALVTGAGSGIGRAVAIRLAGDGARLGLVGRGEAGLRETAQAAGAPDAVVLPADLTDDDGVRQLARHVGQRLGPLGVLVHCAATITIGRFLGLDVARLDEQYRLNVRAPFLLTQLLLPGVIAARGQVVFVNSSAGLAARAGVSQYAASKHALKALADSLREECRADGVRVISIYPGRTATPMQQAVRRMEGAPYDPAACLQPDDVAAAIVDALTAGETAELTDISIRPSGGGQRT